jgi:hypothetical protein
VERHDLLALMAKLNLAGMRTAYDDVMRDGPRSAPPQHQLPQGDAPTPRPGTRPVFGRRTGSPTESTALRLAQKCVLSYLRRGSGGQLTVR